MPIEEDNKAIMSPEKDFSDVAAQCQTLFPLEAKRQVPHGGNETPTRSRFTVKTFTIPLLSAKAFVYFLLHTSMYLHHNKTTIH